MANIYESLKKDHDLVLDLVDHLISLDRDSDRRDQVVSQIRDALIPHARAEEAILYNTLRTLPEGKAAVREGYKEHLEAETKLRSLQAKQMANIDWRETAKDLRSALIHHIREEEGHIFDIARKLLTNEEAQMMGAAFEQLKPEIKDEGILQTTLEMITNMMPERFVPALRSINLQSRV